MRFLFALLLSSTLLASRARAATIAFSDIPSTNVVNATDQLLLNSHLGGASYATRTITVSSLPGDGTANWVASGTTNSTLAGTAYVGKLGLGTNGVGWVEMPPFTDTEGGTVYGAQTLNPFQDGVMQIEQNLLTNFWGAPASVVAIYTTTYGDEIPISLLASNNVSVFVAGEGPIDSGATFSNNSSVYGIGSFPFSGTTMTGNNAIYSWGTDTFDHTTVLNSIEVFAYDHDPFFSAYITNGFRVFGRGYRPFLNAIIDGGTRIVADGGNSPLSAAHLTNCVNLSAVGGSAGSGISGSYTNIFLWGDGAAPTQTANQHVFGDSSVTSYRFPGSAVTIGGTITSGAPSGGTAAAWKLGAAQTGYAEADIAGAPIKLVSQINGTITAVKAFQQYQGTLTHAGTVTLDFDAATTANFIQLTGNVTFAFSNIATNRTYNLLLQGCSTNSTISWPANTHGQPAATSTANKWMRCSLEAWGATATNVFISSLEDF